MMARASIKQMDVDIGIDEVLRLIMRDEIPASILLGRMKVKLMFKMCASAANIELKADGRAFFVYQECSYHGIDREYTVDIRELTSSEFDTMMRLDYLIGVAKAIEGGDGESQCTVGAACKEIGCEGLPTIGKKVADKIKGMMRERMGVA